jgi:hypothetical protein
MVHDFRKCSGARPNRRGFRLLRRLGLLTMAINQAARPCLRSLREPARN